MPLSRRQLLRAGLALPAGLAAPWMRSGWRLAAQSVTPQADLTQLDGEDVVFAHISDAHMRPDDPFGVLHLKKVLERVRACNPAFLLETGDLTQDNTGASLESYLQAYDQQGGFSRYPDYGPGIPLIPVAGNHEFCGVIDEQNGVIVGSPFPEYMGPPPPYPQMPIAPTKHSFCVGNYRFVGTSSNPDWLETWPHLWLERELELSCADGRSAVLFHHHNPHGWMRPDAGELEISVEGSAKIDALAQRSPVLAYLCGHCHYERFEAMPPGYVAHSVARAVLRDGAGTATGPGPFSLYALADGHINLNVAPGPDVFVVTTRPGQFIETDVGGTLKRLDYTRTLAAPTSVRAYARARGGSIAQVNYRLDGGPTVGMQRIGSTSYWEAPLDATPLSGSHSITVTAKAAIETPAGTWRPESSHEITCAFAASVPVRAAPACGSRRLVLPLAPGWNLVSVPFVPLHNTLPAALSSIEGSYSAVLAYDVATETWLRYSPNGPAMLNNLTSITPRRGYWILMTREASLYLSGEPLTPSSIALKAGWNLVGYPGQNPLPATEALASIAGKYDCVYAYENSADPQWRTYIVDSVANSLDHMVPGVGYWILATTDCTWVVP